MEERQRKPVSISVAVLSGLIVSTTSYATPPFDQWYLDGNNEIQDLSGWANNTLVKDKNFDQSTGKYQQVTYLRQVIAEHSTTVPTELQFSDEAIIRVNFGQPPRRTNTGIALKNRINEIKPDEASDFDNITEIKADWATTPGVHNSREITIENIYVEGGDYNPSLLDSAGQKVEEQTFSFGFLFDREDTDGDGKNDAKAIVLTQAVALDPDTIIRSENAHGGAQMFAMHQLEGNYTNGGQIRGLNTRGHQTISWVQGEAIKVIGVGQQITIFPGDDLTSNVGAFGYIRAENVTQQKSGVAISGFGSNALHIGDDPFGTSPGISAEDWTHETDFDDWDEFLYTVSIPPKHTANPDGATLIPKLFNVDSFDPDHQAPTGHEWANK